MVESSEYKQIALIPPNPVTTRAFPVSWSVHPQETFVAYPCKNNIIFRNLKEPLKSLVYTDLLNKPTSVKYSPDGNYLAVGTDNGKVRIISYNQESKEFIVKKEHSMLNADVYDIAFTEDGQRIVAVGAGKDLFAKAIIADSGSKLGDLFGPNKSILSVDIKNKPYRMIMGGENYEIYVFDGVPFKTVKTLHTHQNFINKVAFNQDGSQFASVSSDKSIVIHNTESMDEISRVANAHSKGIIDIAWIDNENVMTCSTDNTIKKWNIKDASETLVLKINDLEEKLEYQQLGVKILSDKVMSVTYNTNINIWDINDLNTGKTIPSSIIQGHSTNIMKLLWFQGQLISADQDGRIFSYKDQKTQQFLGECQSIEVILLISNNMSVFIAQVDGTVRRAIQDDNNNFVFQVSQKHDSLLSLVPGLEKSLFALTSRNVILQLDDESLTEVKRHEFKEGDATFLTYSSITNEIWLGDKKGLIHILDGYSFEKKQVIEKKHNNGITYMTVSKDGKLIASGDSYRYIYVFDVISQEEVACFPYHSAQISQLDFNKDGTLLLTTSFDRNVGIANIVTKTKKIINKPNEKDVKSAIFDEENRVITAGYDCCIRIWSL